MRLLARVVRHWGLHCAGADRRRLEGCVCVRVRSDGQLGLTSPLLTWDFSEEEGVGRMGRRLPTSGTL